MVTYVYKLNQLSLRHRESIPGGLYCYFMIRAINSRPVTFQPLNLLTYLTVSDFIKITIARSCRPDPRSDDRTFPRELSLLSPWIWVIQLKMITRKNIYISIHIQTNSKSPVSPVETAVPPYHPPSSNSSAADRSPGCTACAALLVCASWSPPQPTKTEPKTKDYSNILTI